ncbi:MAG: YchF-related putative GTPase [Thermoplasmataceae archaeon]
MTVKIGLVGKPNVGKSTIFSAMTRSHADIANYPFTTLKPNVGITYIETMCPHTEIGKQCNPREGYCENGIRRVPIEIIDVPGLIPGASQGKGMGNEFLDNLRDSEALCHIIDGSGLTAPDGTPIQTRRKPWEDIETIEGEIKQWLADRIYRDWDKFARKADSSGENQDRSLHRKIASFGLTERQVSLIFSRGSFPARFMLWTEEDAMRFSEIIFEFMKPIFRIANKADNMEPGSREELLEKFPEAYLVSGEFELAFEKALKSGLIKGSPGDFEITRTASRQQSIALDRIKEFFRDPAITLVSQIMGRIVQEKLGYVIVFPVVDESTWEDNKGNVLPDALLMPAGSTALDLAFKIHTEIGEGFIRAVDCRTRRVIGKDHVLANSDIIRVVSKTR